MKQNFAIGYKGWCFVTALFFGVASAEAGVNLHNVPLQTGSTVPPNVMFIIDDSGSMMWESMPDDLTYKFGISALALWMFPRVDKLHGNDYSSGIDQNATIPFSGDLAAEFRSIKVNKIYYDPAVTYLPWVNADGSVMANSDPEAAMNRPMFDSMGTRNLTINNQWTGNWRLDDGTLVNETRTFYPAVYYHYVAGDVTKESSYERVEIKPGNAPFTGHGRAQRTDCAIKDSCTYNEEIQNFANWYSYHRNRIFASRGGIGRAFAQFDGGMRVGYATINTNEYTVDGVAGRAVVSGVRDFTGASKLNFFNELYTRPIPADGTPLRRALSGVGEYFRRTDNAGPWGDTPGTASTLEQLTCRQNFAILMTDGYWTGGSTFAAQVAGARANTDGSVAQNTTNISIDPDTEDYVYEPEDPFKDNYSDTLADVAMYYWKRDLRPDMENNVAVSTGNNAFWQHMVTYGVGLGVQGSIDPDTAMAALKANTPINWPDPQPSVSNCGTSPGLCAARIDDLLHAAINSRGGFFSADRPDEFSAKLATTLSGIIARTVSASNLVGATSSLETDKQIFQGRFFSGDWTGDLWGYDVTDRSTPNWKAAELLDARNWASRQIFYAKSLGAEVGEVFSGASVPGLTEDQVNFLRGDQSKELNKPDGIFRIRNSILGDIAHSSPFYVGEPENRFYERFSEWSAAERNGYSTFLAANKGRTKVVYVGSNSGMLHAFNAVTGQEEFAFIPHNLLGKLPALTSPDYEHQYYVDGSVAVADAYVNLNWRSVLVGTSGRGGQSVFALDVTQPGTFNASRVLWEKSIPELGNYIGKPIIAKLRDDKWYAILGSGVNSSNHGASLILIPLDGGTHRVITAASGTAAAPNALFQPEGWDIDNSGRMGRFFAGDLQGNVWEFDLTDKSPSKWEVAYSGSPLFVARDADGVRQSITGGIAVAMDIKSGNLWVYFGTGKYLEQDDPNITQTQTWYGLVLPVTEESKGKGKGRGIIEETGPIAGRSQLAKRTLHNVNAARVVTDTENLEGKRGWYIDLIDSGERIVSTPQLVGNALVINTMVPQADQCSAEGFGYVMAIDPFQGKRLNRSFFDIDGSKLIDDGDLVDFNGEKVHASGMRFESAPGEPIFYKDTMSTTLENADIVDVVVDTETRLGRVSWREVIN